MAAGARGLRRGLAVAAIGAALALGASGLRAAEDPGPAWSQLKPEQQRILAPLKEDWPNLEGFRKRKWIGLANSYPQMTRDEQARVQKRMRDWAALSREEREAAREFYREIEKLPPEKKQTVREKWEAYQQLPEEKRRELSSAGAKPGDPPAATLVAPPPGKR
ncbi:MAG: DUF3106 domain-containing protein [Burkholderiales bacterium]|nr:DUF3106 domain-containing protein [Burkholderiales bacterium]